MFAEQEAVRGAAAVADEVGVSEDGVDVGEGTERWMPRGGRLGGKTESAGVVEVEGVLLGDGDSLTLAERVRCGLFELGVDLADQGRAVGKDRVRTLRMI